jgi:hypothetical protein
MAERDELALREALRTLGPDEPVDPEAARRQAKERRRIAGVAVGIAAVLVLVVGVIGIPRLFPAGQAQPTSAGPAGPGSGPSAASAPTDPAPAGWRTEYYRDISFEVPENWGYAVAPQSDWCAYEPKGKAREDQRRPYVWLGPSIAIRMIRCPIRPASLLTEHVEALAPGRRTDRVEGAIKQGDWWVVTRFAGSAVLVATTKDRKRAERILDSAQVEPAEAPCRPSSRIAGPAGTRPDGVTDLSRLSPVDWVVLCQYEPLEGRDPLLPRLRAAVRLDQATSQALVTELASAPVNDAQCPAADVSGRPDVAVLVRIWIGGDVYQVFVNAAGCTDGRAGMAGGIDDGTTVRILTAGACRQLLTPPVALWSASGTVANNCLR